MLIVTLYGRPLTGRIPAARATALARRLVAFCGHPREAVGFL